MNMLVETYMYEALTEAGVKPDTARKVERTFENAIVAGQEAMRAEMHDRLATKTELAEMESRLLRAMNDQTWKLVSFVVVANGAMLAIFKFIN